MREKFNKIIIYSLATVIVVLLLAWLVIFFLGGKVKQSFENYQKEKLNSFILEEKRNKISKLKKELLNLEEEKNNLSSMLVKKDEYLPFLVTVEKIARDTSCSIKIEPVDIKKIKFEKKKTSGSKSQNTDDLEETKSKNQSKTSLDENKKEEKEDDLASLKNYPAFSIEVVGHFSALVDFFEKFENMPYFVQPLIIDIYSGEKKLTAGEVLGPSSMNTTSSSENENPDEKNIRMTMTFVVYTQD